MPIDRDFQSSSKPHLPLGWYRGYRLIRTENAVYALPPGTPAEFSAGDGRGILSGLTAFDVERRIDAELERIPIEYAGWLSVMKAFGDCGGHPQFAHITTPPDGFRFLQVTNSDGVAPPLSRAVPIFVARYTALLLAIARLTWSALREGARPRALWEFFRTRKLTEQLRLPRSRLIFFPSIPATIGQHRWLIEIEDLITLFFPFVRNGATARVELEREPCFPIIRALLRSPRCVGIVTHIRSTAEALPHVFNDASLAEKISYVPFGIAPQGHLRTRAENGSVELLFTNSWHQDPTGFFYRGGLDVLAAFAKLRERYPTLRLTIRSRMPFNLEETYRQRIPPTALGEVEALLRNHYPNVHQALLARAPIKYQYDNASAIEGDGLRLFEGYLFGAEMEQVFASADIFLLPSARVHVVSILQAMAHGLTVVTSDGWGIDEYVTDSRNGLIVKGREGIATWVDPTNGMLREDYIPLFNRSPQVTEALVNAVSKLIENPGLCRDLAAQARSDVAGKFSIDSWNQGLKSALLRALEYAS